MQIKYGVKFIVQKCIDLMQKVHDKNIEIMKTFLTSIKSYEEEEMTEDFIEVNNKNQEENADDECCQHHCEFNEECISDAYDENFKDEMETNTNYYSLKGFEYAIFEYIDSQIESYHMDDSHKYYLLNIASKEFQAKLHLTAAQVSRALRSLANKKMLTRRGYQGGENYYYELTIPIEVLQ